MTAEALVNFVNNDKAAYDRVTFAVRHLRHTLDHAARAVAHANAEWHDDPEAEDHAEYHASAIEQFPLHVRDKAVLELVNYYLAELKRG